MENLLPKEIRVVLGGKEQSITEKKIHRMAAWRRMVAPYIARLVSLQEGESGEGVSSDRMADFCAYVFSEGMDVLQEAFWEYASEVDRKAIEGQCTDEEIIQASLEVLRLTLPFFQMMMERFAAVNLEMKATGST